MQFAIPATASSIQNRPISCRLHGLDALRGIATVLVVLLHAGIPYMTQPMPFLVWPAKEAHPCPIVDGLTWCSECFLMPLFFMLAGFFSCGLLISRGERDFLTSRTRRLLTPQLVGMLTVLPMCLWIWSMGWAAEGAYEPQDYFLRGIPPELESEMFGVAHLWFLQNLYIYCLVLCGVSWLAKQVPAQNLAQSKLCAFAVRQIDNLMASIWKPLIPAIPCALILYSDTRIVIGFYQGFVPVFSKLVYYAIYFFVGATVYRHREKLHLHARFAKRYLLIAGILFSAALPLIHEHVIKPLTGSRLALMSGVLALFACFTVFGLIAICLQSKNDSNAATRYLAEASFWMYLVHLPLVVLAQIAIAHLQIAAMAKFFMTGITSIILSLVTYQAFVRGTWLGEILDGRCPKFLARARNLGPVINPNHAISSVEVVLAGRNLEIQSAKLRIDHPANHRESGKIAPPVAHTVMSNKPISRV